MHQIRLLYMERFKPNLRYEEFTPIELDMHNIYFSWTASSLWEQKGTTLTSKFAGKHTAPSQFLQCIFQNRQVSNRQRRILFSGPQTFSL